MMPILSTNGLQPVDSFQCACRDEVARVPSHDNVLSGHQLFSSANQVIQQEITKAPEVGSPSCS